ncbi:MAG: hypothetical protein V4813_09660 [Gemmatimonadota bacterium]
MRPATAPPSDRPASRLQSRRGMAMVLVLILVVVMSLGAAAGFARSSSEYTTTTNMRAQADAWNVAYAGMERYLILTTNAPATLPVTFTYTFSNGTAVVTLERVRAAGATSAESYLLRSVGTVTNRRTSSKVPVATRTLTQIVQRQKPALDVDAAFVALGGLGKNGTSGNISGVDECGVKPMVPGLAVPNALYVPGSNSPQANDYIDGSPDNAPSYLGPPGIGETAGTANAAVRVDWESVLDGSSMQPDFTINRVANPNTGAFPSSYANFPVVRITGNVTGGDNFNGKGVLIVTGNADISNIQWEGVVLIGGEVTISGSNARVKGALLTGLNLKISPLSTFPYLPQTYPSAGAVGNGNSSVRYNSCAIANALNRYDGWLRVANTWADNWPTP